ncbi:MAG: hypothetical protein KDK91_23555 [Gammaproteobacteria bacterium]|nr:hypothetical protein [Gammaproteobacteria bacterium]
MYKPIALSIAMALGASSAVSATEIGKPDQVKTQADMVVAQNNTTSSTMKDSKSGAGTKDALRHADNYKEKDKYKNGMSSADKSEDITRTEGRGGAGTKDAKVHADDYKDTTKYDQVAEYSKLDADNDGYLTRAEAMDRSALTAQWNQLDTNDDNRLDRAEFARFEFDPDRPSDRIKTSK